MELHSLQFLTIIVALQYFPILYFVAAATDRISSLQPIKDPEALVSSAGNFKLGFFTPSNATNRYVGIWYNNYNSSRVIWVANRSKPLNDSSGVVTISEDGNLVVLNVQEEVVWKSNLSSRVSNSSAVLREDGNLVLLDDSSGNTLWESFLHPCDTWLTTMKISTNEKTGDKLVQLTSWKSPHDPSPGSFSTGLDPSSIPQIFTWKDGHPYWRSGAWTGQTFLGIFPGISTTYLNGFSLVEDGGVFSLSYNMMNGSILPYLAVDSQGKFRQWKWNAGKNEWEDGWRAPDNDCEVYGQCGEFGICNPKTFPICSCLWGFEPKDADEWKQGTWSSGCVRRTMLECEIDRNGTATEKKDGFLRLKTVKVPDFAQLSSIALSLQECGDECSSNCSCNAYSYYDGFGCMIWTSNLIDTQVFSSDGAELYIRLAQSELPNDHGSSNQRVVISITTITGAIVASICAFFMWRCLFKGSGNKLKNKILLINRSRASPLNAKGSSSGESLKIVQLHEVPLFKLQQLMVATSYFDVSNKLGQGGFGPVYKGKMPDEQEIAVKRLSRASNQGREEFINEVEVISKLQHRNLVRLLGCCIEGDEKMLVYEFMPNGSLDAFLFDPHKKVVLDWRKRFNVIQGTCRGLLYLHRDSRLKIVHRDLKPSNILLDQELNPNISDFGMARIFGGNEDQANTRKVVGTYGYMPPEYAIHGRFSDKSDVFSFGVLLLEIIIGRRNTSFYDNKRALSLLGFAWNLWNEGKITELVDAAIYDPCFYEEICRCLHIGLLCVQENAKDRPTISAVMSMLNSEILDLPTPKPPGFVNTNFQLDDGSTQGQDKKRSTMNNVSITIIEGR